jgi:hypothetical protein
MHIMHIAHSTHIIIIIIISDPPLAIVSVYVNDPRKKFLHFGE